MMKRKRHSAEFKAKIALDSLNMLQPVNSLAKKHKIHPGQITQWKKQLIDNATLAFEKKRKSEDSSNLVDELYQKIGQLQVELEWLKKKTVC